MLDILSLESRLFLIIMMFVLGALRRTVQGTVRFSTKPVYRRPCFDELITRDQDIPVSRFSHTHPCNGCDARLAYSLQGQSEGQQPDRLIACQPSSTHAMAAAVVDQLSQRYRANRYGLRSYGVACVVSGLPSF